MASKSNNIKILALILIAVVLLSSCINQSSSKRTVYKGYKGLEASFSKSIPDNLYENSSFYTRVMIVNEGTYTINQSNPGVASITTDEFYMQYDKKQWNNNKTFTLEGKSTLFPNGEFIIFNLPNISMQLLPGAIQKPETELQFSLCYPYQTTFSENVCIDVDPYEQDERPKVCKSEELSLGGGQGSPLGVTKITPMMTSTTGTIKPMFIIEIKNHGKGIPLYNESNEKLCGNLILNNNNLNKVKITGVISNSNLTCEPEIIKLIDNKGTTRCTADATFGEATNFLAPLNLQISFSYFQSITKKFDIIRTQEYDPLAFVTSKSCEGLNERDSCVTTYNKTPSMICDEHKQCVNRCDYCAKHVEESLSICEGIGVDFSCACRSEDQFFMPESKFALEACEFDLCCDQGERGIGIYYASKDHFYEETYPTKYTKLGQNKKANLKPLIDYKFKPFYSNSNAYCVFHMLKQYENQAKQLLFTTNIKLCSDPANTFEYMFNESEIGEIYELQVAAYETATSETAIIRSTHELTIKEASDCQYNGQILANNMVCSLEFNVFEKRNKCVFCNMNWNSDIEFCKQEVSGFRDGMSCSCDEDYLVFLDADDYVTDIQNFCQDEQLNYCCLHPEAIHNYLNINMDCSGVNSCTSYVSGFEGITAAQVCLADPCNIRNITYNAEDFCYWDYENNNCKTFDCDIQSSCFDYNLLTMSGVVSASEMCSLTPDEQDFCNYGNCYWSETQCVGGSHEEVECNDPNGCIAYGTNQEWCVSDGCNFARYGNIEYCYWDGNVCVSMITDTILGDLNCENINSCDEYTFEYLTYSPEEICLADPCGFASDPIDITDIEASAPCYWNEQENHCRTFDCNLENTCETYNLLNYLGDYATQSICNYETTCDYKISDDFYCSWGQGSCYDTPRNCENGPYNNDPNLCNFEQGIRWGPLECYHDTDQNMCHQCPNTCEELLTYNSDVCYNLYDSCNELDCFFDFSSQSNNACHSCDSISSCNNLFFNQNEYLCTHPTDNCLHLCYYSDNSCQDCPPGCGLLNQQDCYQVSRDCENLPSCSWISDLCIPN